MKRRKGNYFAFYGYDKCILTDEIRKKLALEAVEILGGQGRQSDEIRSTFSPRI